MSICTNCKLCYHAGNQMLPSGEFNADFYFVLSHPTSEESRRPSLDEYCSNETKLFFSFLESLQIRKRSRFFYLTRCTPFNVMYPDNYVALINTNGPCYCGEPERQPMKDEISNCSKYLLADIRKNKPFAVIAMGREVTSFLLQRNITAAEFDSYVGRVYESSIEDVNFKIVPIYSIKDCYEEYSQEDKSKNSIQKRVVDVLNQLILMKANRWIEVEKNNKLTYAMSYEEFRDYYEKNLKDEPELAYDIETNAALVYSKEFDIIGFSLAKRHEGIYVCLQSLDHKMSDEDIQKCKDLLVYALKHTKKIVVHNSLYEMPATRYNLDYDIPADKVDDTMVMAKLMLGGTAGAGLKPTAQAIGYSDWETDLSRYIEDFSYSMKRFAMAGYRDIIKYIRDNPSKSFRDYLGLIEEDLETTQNRIKNTQSQINANNTSATNAKLERELKNFLSTKEKILKYRSKMSDVQTVSNSLESLLKKYYSSEEINNLLPMICQKILYGMDNGTPGDIIPYHWIPCRLLNKYGATDSIATLDIKYDFLKQFKEQSTKEVDLYKGYLYMLKEYYVGYCMMMASMHWDDSKAKKDKEVYYDIMLKTIKFLFKHEVVQKYVLKNKFNAFLGEILYDNYNDILWQTQQHRVGIDGNGNYVHEYLENGKVKRNAYSHISEIQLSPVIKRDCERCILKKILEIVKTSTDLKELRSLFNPASTIPEMSSLADKILMTPKVRFCMLLRNFNTVRSSEEFDMDSATPVERMFWNDFDEYKSIDYKTNRAAKEEKFDYLMKKYYLALLPDKSRGLKEKSLYNTTVIHFNNTLLQKAVQTARDFKAESFDDSSQIAVYEAYLESPMDQNDLSTWDFTFKWLFNFRSFKKAAKMVTSYIDGSVGRNNVWEVSKAELSNGNEVVIREKEYDKTDPDEVLRNPEKDYLYQTNFRVCFTGDVRIPSPDGSSHTFKELVDSGVKELTVYSSDDDGKIITAKATNIKMTEKNSRLVEVIINTDDSIRCTADHLFKLVDGTYKKACELICGDLLMSMTTIQVDVDIDDKGYFKYDYSYEDLIDSVNYGKFCPYVVNVKSLDYSEDVYDLEVPDYNNFAIEIGKVKCFVHNCSAQSFRWQCLTGDTEINVDGKLESLESLYETGKQSFSVLSYDRKNNKTVVGQCTSGVQITGKNAPILKITLDSGEIIRCTPEHKIMLADGTYREAKDLVKNDELMCV